MQEQAANRGEEIIGDRVAMQVNYKYSTPRNATQLSQKLYDTVVFEMMCKQRADRVVECVVSKGQLKCISTHRANFSKHLRLVRDRCCRARIQFQPSQLRISFSLSRPTRRHAQQFA